jgi:hypothetical protein
MDLAARIGLLLTFCIAEVAVAQVRVNVPSKAYKSHEQIVATVTNSGKKSVTVCMELGQTSRV